MVFKRSRKDAMLLTERCQRYTIIGHDKVLRMERGGGHREMWHLAGTFLYGQQSA